MEIPPFTLIVHPDGTVTLKLQRGCEYGGDDFERAKSCYDAVVRIVESSAKQQASVKPRDSA